MTEDDDAHAVRGALVLAGAETINRAREKWWLGIRDVEKEKYTADGSNFDHDERDFRAGFENDGATASSRGNSKPSRLVSIPIPRLNPRVQRNALVPDPASSRIETPTTSRGS